MNDKTIEEKISKIRRKRQELVFRNKTLLSKGDTLTYQMNCNFLKGIEFALEIITKTR